MSKFFGRLSRVFIGKANQGVDALEDATFETTVKQTIRDMEEELSKVVKASAEAMSNHNRLESEYERYRKQSVDWKYKAKKALESGNEELAKKALAKKAQSDRQIDSMSSSVEEAHKVRDKLKGQVAELRNRISEAKRTSSTLIARKNAANAQKKVAQALAGASETDNAFAELDRFEDTIARDEALAKAYDDMSYDTDSILKKEFEDLDIVDVDDELSMLKAEMAGQGQ
ncbi:MAG: PspA/IM30 family protein [Proteobacteria bacterium]|nr:PspA/IM30 family protein [Pseudomonadota bacterium]